ncbi:MAG: phenylalanine--tRNA ligase beta subunit-related protein [Limosilactobacillus gorillae]|jgi:DNA/RNA-binding domain of Phe-tRNA-synthetase-like protein|uniref:B3/B4 domain-containing protein n=1 Tax=Limosilactobacillus gorillae TaxID=1450649 RepID=UPI000A82E301|nr:phenylalanine--tRNA ligase beta subunit-related protein [Limosilactobacillus gorillae]MDO4855146.1 phenylalanine--tRNA ligase beta subunit-related protein [Limosilactobacillus gorillae]
MKKVIIDSGFWNLFPDAQINIMTINGFDNHDTPETHQYRADLLAQAVKESAKFTSVDPFRDNPVVAQWRDAYSQFKKRKGARASIEALLKRANQGHVFEPTIPLVDLYNSISLSYGVPIGIEDLNKIEGDLHLGIAKGGEGFFPLGAKEDDPAREGEVIYYDNGGAVCRSLNWREAERTMLTEETTNGVVVMESVNAEQAARATEAMTQLSKLITDFFMVTPSEQFILTKEHPEAPLN